MNQLEALKQHTTVVADTGDFLQLAQFRPQDATTNPSLILKAVQKPEYAPLLHDTVRRFGDRALDEMVDRLLVRFGCEILATVPGRTAPLSVVGPVGSGGGRGSRWWRSSCGWC